LFAQQLSSCPAASVKITTPVKNWVFKTPQTDVMAVAKIYEYMQGQRIPARVKLVEPGTMEDYSDRLGQIIDERSNV
jgi:hypothetical protein